jgi:hypothetical protein
MYECENALTKAHVSLGIKASSITECNLIEEEEEIPVALSGDGFDIEIKPYEIKTFKINQ